MTGASAGGTASGGGGISDVYVSNVVVVLSAACLFICYCDRVNISVAIIGMAEDLGWDKTTQGR